MGDLKGFLKVKREPAVHRPVAERKKDYQEVSLLRTAKHSQDQASRCMDCGTPFCHSGCPIGNYIPEWNDFIFHNQWDKALALLDANNNLPEITGRICPALCEYACVLGINDEPVTIRENELDIIENAFRNKLLSPKPPSKRTGKKIAIVGSGPAGLVCADQLNSAGNSVTVFEKDDAIGGILRFGIPEFKLEKNILERRINILSKEGIKFRAKVNVGSDYPVKKLKSEFNAICLACGSRTPRDLPLEGRGLKGIHFAMDYLIQSNKRIRGDRIAKDDLIDALGKRVVVIGGGDTGADCVGVAHKQKAKSILQIELMPKPASCRTKDYPWPKYPMIFKSSSSHEEGGERDWSVLTKKFIGDSGKVKKLSCVKVEFQKDSRGCPLMREIPGSEFEIDVDLIILALGFLHPEKKGIIEELKLGLDSRGNVKTKEDYMTSLNGVFSCGDMRRGQSLVVWAISEGRRAAHYIDKYLNGDSQLPLI
ncbi:MAG TPA: glutamate synthase subunit beta [Candidatus Omnitrophota bacterium]|nr:glutamate synthase subunit beta [Candidatus Omnitrophota bacterium]